MDERLKRSSSEVHVLKQQNQVDSNGEDAGKVGNKRKTYDQDNTSQSHNQKNLRTVKQEDQLEYAKAKMSTVKEENENLKVLLDSIVKEHQTLETHIFEIVQQEKAMKSTHTTSTENQAEECHDLVFLSLGRSYGNVMNKEKSSNLGKSKESEAIREGLSLGLDSRFDVSSSSGTETSSYPRVEHAFHDLKKEKTRGQCALSNNLKPTKREDDDVALAPQALAKKVRVSVRARCDGPTMNDGCQWRKYGHKISKGNPCPRAYYRCTVGQTCQVRKQVQRCGEDISILTSTYEGAHNHPLPVSVTTMASATSAEVKRVYDALEDYEQDRNSNQQAIFPNKQVWAKKVPGKVEFMVWLAAHQKLLTLDNLQSKGFRLANKCYLCHEEEETVIHLLNNCGFTKKIWEQFTREENEEINRITVKLNQVYNGTTTRLSKILLQYLTHAMFFEVWKERNRRCFEEKTLSWLQVCHHVMETLWEWNMDEPEVKSIRLERLMVDWNKLVLGG